MLRVGARDRPAAGLAVLSLLESATLDVIMKAFVKGLFDDEVRKDTIRGLTTTGRSLRGLCTLAEDADRAKKELHKLLDEEHKTRELDFYRDVVRQNMAQEKIESLLATYRAQPVPKEWAFDNPFEKPSLTPQVAKPAPLGETSGNSTHRPKPNNQSYHPRPYSGNGDRRSQFHRPQSKDLPSRSTSLNKYINGSRTWGTGDGPLCVKCGEIGHMSRECSGTVLPAWEQSYLKSIVFGDNPQSNFCAARFGSYDGNTQPYGTSRNFQASSSSFAPSSSKTGESPSSCSISYGIAEDVSYILPVRSSSVDAMYGEGSGPSKRPHMEDPRPRTMDVPDNTSGVPGPSFPSGTRTKKKGQKMVGKKSEPQPLVGMFDDSIGTYEKPISVRQMLRESKVDMSWMDWMAWSPEACKEMKRLCTKVTKRRIPKAKAGQGPGTNKSTPFNPTFPPRSALPSLPSMFPLQATQPMFHPTGQSQNYNQPVQYAPANQVHPQTYHTVQQPVQATAVPQQAPPAPPIPVQPQYIPVVQPTSQQFQTQDIGNSGEVLSVEADGQTQFLKTLRGVEKAFRIECTITSGTGTSMNLGKAITQADQGSEMNVISDSIRAQIGAPKKALSDIGFHGLTMRTADHRDTRLDYWTEFTITTSRISRLIRCFIAPRVTIAGSSRSGHFNLLLGLPWLFSVNAHISIRESKITIGDPAMGETMRDIIGPEMVFCTEHTLIMYPLKAFPETEKSRPASEKDSESSEDDEDSDSGEDLSEFEDVVPVRVFDRS